jgi:arylsulfatase A-like enzyme
VIRHLCLAVVVLSLAPAFARAADRPNIVLVYADDLGYGDSSAYGATAIRTPNIDRLAAAGLRFTDGHAPAATCTPSRYALLTGEYAWRRPGTNVLPGDAALVIDPSRTTLASMLKRAGYATGIVGKWHLGLGPTGGPDWNGVIAPGPNELGFDEAFIMAATGDRVPTVYIENRRIVGLDASDPITVSYDHPVGDWPTGKEHPELLTMRSSHGHDQTIVNGIGRIGYMTGGKAALWKDPEMAQVFAGRATAFIERHKDEPFFLYAASHDPHVPRVPHPRFKGATALGPRGDAIVQFDWQLGEILDTLDRLHLSEKTLVIFTSDNGPVVDDGYKDEALEKLDGHRPAGPYRGGKYSRFEGGTRVPWVVRWPGGVKPGVSGALVCQVDLLASLAAFAGQSLAPADAPDSANVLDALLGRSATGRQDLVEQGWGLALRQGSWKYIEPGGGTYDANTRTELGGGPSAQLYDLSADPGETKNIAAAHPDRVAAMRAELAHLRQAGRSRQ